MLCEKRRHFLKFFKVCVSVGFMLRHIMIYYMEESVLLGTKSLVDSMRLFIRDASGVFSICHLCECRSVQ